LHKQYVRHNTLISQNATVVLAKRLLNADELLHFCSIKHLDAIVVLDAGEHFVVVKQNGLDFLLQALVVLLSGLSDVKVVVD